MSQQTPFSYSNFFCNFLPEVHIQFLWHCFINPRQSEQVSDGRKHFSFFPTGKRTCISESKHCCNFFLRKTKIPSVLFESVWKSTLFHTRIVLLMVGKHKGGEFAICTNTVDNSNTKQATNLIISSLRNVLYFLQKKSG